jgi:arabinose-5-phosphate isomerase
MGVGKSGHIASKIAATLASTGTPAFFVHPTEAGHGDFGMIKREDCAIIISNSGATTELISLLPSFNQLNIPLITITSKPLSNLSLRSKVVLNTDVQKEACPYNLAPTSSTTAALVLGDAIAITLLKARNFTRDNFSFFHPNGALGKRLLLTIDQMMTKGKNLPMVATNASIEEVIIEISSKGLGICIVSDDRRNLKGVFTDGDLRRMFCQHNYEKGKKIREFIERHPEVINYKKNIIEALKKMKECKITSLIAVDDRNEIKGIIHMHDLIREGIA